jgi:hypothetical protein
VSDDALVIATPVDPEIRRLREQRDQALAVLDPAEAIFVQAFVDGGSAADAARIAGFKDAVAAGKRLKKRVEVRRAVTGVLRARTAEQEFTRGDAIRMLRQMLEVRLEDVCEINEQGVVIGLKDLASLPTAVTARIKSAFVHTHASAQGQRAHYRKTTIVFSNAMEVLDRLARLESWVDDRPEVRIAIAGLQQSQAETPLGLEGWRALHEIADAVLDDEQLPKYLAAYRSGDRGGMLSVLRTEVERLRLQRTAIPCEVVE